MQKFIVDEEYIGQRIDIFLSNNLPKYSRAYIQKLIKSSVTVNEQSTRPSYKLRYSDNIELNTDIEQSLEIEVIDIPILYEDKYCIVIDKPEGVLSHSKGNFNSEGTVESFISDKIHGFEGQRPGIVHRLDRGTSGVMICAKDPESFKWLQNQFSTRKVKKTYVAIIKGHLANPEAIIDLPIARNPKSPATFKVSSNGKPATTTYKVLSESKSYTLLQLMPKTGRTHQLRVHLSYLGHSILGDNFYKGKKADRLYLHAKELEIMLPNKEVKVFKSKLPDNFVNIIDTDNE